LPEIHKRNNVEAYAGCICWSRANQEQISRTYDEKQDSKKVKVIEEKTYPLDYIISESTLKEAIKMANMTEDEVKEAANIVVSIKVSAVKKQLAMNQL
jgi:hypothetical protein